MKKHTLKKEKDFVQIPNGILTNSKISLKAKGVLALMLSLPNNWNFSIEGIASKCKESRESIANAIKELEKVGYIKRTMMRGDDGKITRMEYEIFEEPYTISETEKPNGEKPCGDKSCAVNPSAEEPSTDNPLPEKPSMVFSEKETPSKENRWINNIKTNKTENNNILYNNTQSNPISSKRKLSFNMSEMDIYRNAIRDNIDYDILAENNPTHKDMLDEIVELMTETVCSKRETITIASDTHSVADVKKRFMDINSEHIQYVIECLNKNTTKISNIKQYLLASIFNAPNTMESYYTTKVNQELYG